MRVWRVLVLLAPALLLGGCGYVHFGKLPNLKGDMELERAYVDLSVQRKILQQELVLARKETDTLRDALDHAAAGPAPAATELTRQLDSATQELATLRVNYAKLQRERNAEPPKPAAESEDQEAATREMQQLQAENAQLKHDLNAARTENASLAQQLKTSLASAERAQATAAQLDRDLAAQREARAQAEQAMSALKAQLDAVMARAAPAATAPLAVSAPSSLPESRTPAPANLGSLAALQEAKAPPSGDAPAVELRSNVGQPHVVVSASNFSSPLPTAAPPAAPAAAVSISADAGGPAAAPTAVVTPKPADVATQVYKVRPGDTLEKIATRFYGSADQWGKIYAANADALTANQGLKPGMELQIPEK